MDEQTIPDISQRFYEAASAVLRGDCRPMLELWSASDDVSYAAPNGEIVSGATALRAYWDRAAQANMAVPGMMTAVGEDVVIRNAGPIGYTVTVEHITVHQGEGAGHVHLRARATNVYRLEDRGWRLLHRHAEPPVEEAAPAPNAQDAGK